MIGWLLAFGAPLAIALAVILAYNHAFFGTLLMPPFDRSEGFTTPVLQGLAGLLLSPGKGVLWYAPLAWLALIGVFRWRDAWTAAGFPPGFRHGVVRPLSLQRLVRLGGRTVVGTAFSTTMMPALALMTLPALDGLVSRSWPRPARIAVWTVLVLSVVAQLPGVLVSFSAQEALDVKAGLSLSQLRWTWTHSPLVSYWQAIGSPTTDPLLGQRALWGQRPTGMILTAGAWPSWSCTGDHRASSRHRRPQDRGAGRGRIGCCAGAGRRLATGGRKRSALGGGVSRPCGESQLADVHQGERQRVRSGIAGPDTLLRHHRPHLAVDESRGCAAPIHRLAAQRADAAGR